MVITAAGILTALGRGWNANATAFRAGKTAFRPSMHFDVSRQRVKTAAEIDLPENMPATRLSARSHTRLDRAAKMLLIAAAEAWEQSGWDPSEDLPLILGTTGGGMSLGEAFFRQAIREPISRRGQAERAIYYQAHRQGLVLCEALGFSGPLTLIANACASGANAIGHAWEWVRTGRAERVLAGGYDAITQLVFAGFDSLQALSPTRCRPFDAGRDGLALGEGAAVLAIESLDHARRRNANILGEVCGYAAITDTYHLTQPQPEGKAAFATMRAACAQASVAIEDIGYINAHGTGTSYNDTAEALAINEIAGSAAGRMPVSSTKACIGHLLGGAGAVETVVCLMALHGQWLPPEPGIETPDPICKFPIVREPKDAKLRFAMTNSFGFGGASASLILKGWQ
ncbi:MAG TPA: beta-ketoacyl-[acyl-carrier-protein] synthase family protein [Verrucomicrobiae bacterium]|nr:beta-ketoacyl-[acyl-carrier-protein] synthase family protein [Verrucomicrobiae bacterium]